MIGASATYQDLVARTDRPTGSSWGVFGVSDEVGSLNRIGAAEVRRAVATVRKGEVFNLNLPMGEFEDPLVGSRGGPNHVIFSSNANHRDDYLDGLYLQGTTQVDGLRHFRHPEHGFYNGVSDESIAEGSPVIGVNRWAERGIVGRGVLADMERFYRRCGVLAYRVDEGFAITAENVQAALDQQGVEVQGGDILLVRTGWLPYARAMGIEDRARYRANAPVCPGLVQATETLEWLWDKGFSMVASDNLGVEVLPPVDDSPFRSSLQIGSEPDIHAGLMHRALIPLLGFALGELWDLEALADDCEADGRWDFLVTACPLNLVGGVGSPANALAIK